MCTIGIVRNKSGKMILFKNLDQIGESSYPEPSIYREGKYAYLGFNTMLTSPCGISAGINECGVALVGADGNGIVDLKGEAYADLCLSLYGYRDVLAQSPDIYTALDILMRYYHKRRLGGNGDIIIISDTKEAVAVEYSYPSWGIEFLGSRPYLIRTNFFNTLRHLRPAQEENTVNYSSALRYARAFHHLSLHGPQTDENDIELLLRDHGNGPSAMSICRHGGEGEYVTLCSFIFTVTSYENRVRYLINGKPCQKTYKHLIPDWRS